MNTAVTFTESVINVLSHSSWMNRWTWNTEHTAEGVALVSDTLIKSHFLLLFWGSLFWLRAADTWMWSDGHMKEASLNYKVKRMVELTFVSFQGKINCRYKYYRTSDVSAFFSPEMCLQVFLSGSNNLFLQLCCHVWMKQWGTLMWKSEWQKSLTDRCSSDVTCSTSAQQRRPAVAW